MVNFEHVIAGWEGLLYIIFEEKLYLAWPFNIIRLSKDIINRNVLELS